MGLGGVIVCCVASLVLASACSVGDKADRAERIHRSVAALAPIDAVAKVDYELTLDVPALRAPSSSSPSVPDAVAARVGRLLAGGASLRTRAELEPASRKAVVRVGDEAEPSVIFEDTKIFVKRRNARPTERRQWAQLDLADLSFDRGIGVDDLEAPALSHATAIAINPMYFVELVLGVLAGSVEVVGTKGAGGAATTQYRFNLSFDKALTDLDFSDDERATRLGVFRQLGMRKDVVPARAWLDTEGRLRKMQVEVPVEVSVLERHDLTVTVALEPATADVTVTPPPAEQAVTYSALGRLVRAGLTEES